MVRNKAGSACLELMDQIIARLKALKPLLIITAVLSWAACPIAWMPAWGAATIGVSLGMIITCLILMGFVIDRYNQLLKCLP